MSALHSRFNKYLSEYLDKRIVIAMDIVLSLLVSLCVFILLNVLTSWRFRGNMFFLVWMGSALAGTVAALFVCRSYRVIIRHFNIRDLLGFIYDVLIKGVTMLIAVWYFSGIKKSTTIAIFVDVIATLVVVVGVRLLMVMGYDLFRSKAKDLRMRQRVLIYGTSAKSVAAYTRLMESTHYNVVGFIAEESFKGNMRLQEKTVYTRGSDEQMKKLFDSLSIGGVLFASDVDARNEKEGLIALCADSGIKPFIHPHTPYSSPYH